MFFPLLRTELFKIFRKPRTFIAFGAIAIMIFLIQFAIKLQGAELINFLMAGQLDSFEIQPDRILNGYFVCFFILNTLLIHVPLLVALIAGDIVAGEANMGTLRLIAVKPVSRNGLMLAKFTAASVYVLLLLLWMAVLSLFGSMLIFGTNDMMVARETGITILLKSDVIWRFFAAFGFAALSLICIAALAFMLSVFADNSIGPIVATVCIVIVFTIIQQLQVPIFQEYLTPYLFTTHMLGWKGFFYIQSTSDNQAIPGTIERIAAVWRSATILFAYTVLFLGIGLFAFRKKDILS